MRCELNKKEELKTITIKACCDKQFTNSEAAKKLNLSVRQIIRLKKKYSNGISLLHGNCSKPPASTFSTEFKNFIVDTYRKFEFSESNFLQFQELLAEHYNCEISYSALRKILISAKIKSPKAHQKRPTVHKKRPPKDFFGEMLQTDASKHQWFADFGDTNYYCLHGLIDDATGIITGLYMTKNECLEGYFQVLRQTLTQYGSPESIYADGLSIFFPNKKEELSIEEQLEGREEHLTQFGAIVDELAIKLIHARSSQAKGKIERLWETLQSRLTTEFRVHKISDSKRANTFLQSYIKKFNAKFSKKPAKSETKFLPLPDNLDLDTLLSIKIQRKLDNGLCFSLNRVKFLVPQGTPKSKITVLINQTNGIRVLYKEQILQAIPIQDKNNNTIEQGESMQKIIAQFIYFFMLKNERLDKN